MHVLEVDFKELEEDFKELKTNLNSNRRAFTYEARNSTKQ